MSMNVSIIAWSDKKTPIHRDNLLHSIVEVAASHQNAELLVCGIGSRDIDSYHLRDWGRDGALSLS